MAAQRRSFQARPRALLLDTNVLLVLLVGRHSEDLLESFQRTNHYNRADFQAVQKRCRWFEQSKSLLTTPHILTEVSNLLNQLAEPAAGECRRKMASYLLLADERFEEAKALSACSEFERLGITDAAIGSLAGKGVAVFTDDFELGGLLEKRGVTVWNLRRMRSHEPTGAPL